MKVTGFSKLFVSVGATNYGNPGPGAYNVALEEMGVDGVYVALESKQTAADVVEAIRCLGIAGATITKPFKQAVIPYLDRVDDEALKIGAVNVISVDDGQLVGHNSDGLGALNALREAIDPAGKAIALMGAGGAARAIAFHLRKANADVTAFNRSAGSVKEMCETFDLAYGGGIDDVDERFEVIINATSVGMTGQAAVLDLNDKAFSNHPIVFDIITKPRVTELMTRASELGCRVVPGISMSAQQAVFALEWITGVRPSIDTLKAALP